MRLVVDGEIRWTGARVVVYDVQVADPWACAKHNPETMEPFESNKYKSVWAAMMRGERSIDVSGGVLVMDVRRDVRDSIWSELELDFVEVDGVVVAASVLDDDYSLRTDLYHRAQAVVSEIFGETTVDGPDSVMVGRTASLADVVRSFGVSIER